ncbi:DUF72 domain-containing protein [Aestuariimicrobium sp. p3-SID1156]|uniref:DUF72 domain-containing protein n=1 Tax=Aestuariimicrobium sp. p3-SID1156 TaxID=2916038 RepID=UPI00223BA22C|nr:DUF72 domain-containing protein [Aestuariimicrobium sp. p3-SID1156]MCT1458792.1 DUF72 domain-containing protein [Aestuariimicrobium sp. p3-SID1156]
MDGIRIGTSGWSYDHWDGILYPPGTPTARRRDVYVSEFDTVELNASFYRWPRAATFASWQRNLPPGFMMTVKAPRGLTHAKRLYAPEAWVERMRTALHELGDKRGPLLIQTHPAHERDDARLAHVLDALNDACPWLDVAVELRHESWHVPDVWRLLESRGASYVVMSGAHLRCHLVATAPLVYLRWHGPSHDHLYAGSYSDQDLAWWADRIREWRSGGHWVAGYFNNDGHGFAVHNARRLRSLL